jgi:hypothetical protein
MALGFNFGGGAGSGGGNSEIIPILKYDARAGRLSRRDYENGEYVNADVTRSFKAVADLENIEVGWIDFNTGSAPDMVLARHGEAHPSQPSSDHKQGVRLLVKLGKECGGDIREIAGNAKSMLRGIDELHNDYLKGVIDNPNKLPVIVLKDTVPITTGEGTKKSTNYVPIFEIVSWVARPADLVYVPKARINAPASGGAPITGSRQVNAPASAVSSEDDFG